MMAPRSYPRSYRCLLLPWILVFQLNACGTESRARAPEERFPVHSNVISTVFWVGERADSSNGHIANSPSAWDENWVKHFGGVDDPKRRNGSFAAGFTPRENPFYFALPYNDFDESGDRKENAARIPWYGARNWAPGESVLKNRWIRIMKGEKVAYAQWEDVGPFLEDDFDYVFGTAPPSNHRIERAGIDLSPALRDYLGASGVDRVGWQFVDDSDVPDGPWRQIVTTSQPGWK